MMTSNIDKIRKATNGYGVGQLYDTKVDADHSLELEREQGKLFDTTSFNFHLYPKSLSPKFQDDGDDKFEQLNCKIRFEVKKKLREEEAKKIITVNGRKGNRNSVYKIFNYVCTTKTKKPCEKNDVAYEINFMRFFIDLDNNVNCILNAIQFDRCVGGFVNKTTNGECDICYPTSYQSQENELLKILKKRKNQSFCYNPKIPLLDVDDTMERAEEIAEIIATKFIAFVKICENYDCVSV